jgi:hypothetical protein
MLKLVACWKVSLRGMMIVIALLAIWLGWRVNKASNQRETVAIIKKHGGRVAYDWSGPATKGPSGRTPPGPVWLRKWLGDEYFQELVYVNMAYSDPELSDVTPRLGTFASLNSLDLPVDGSQGTDQICRDLEACQSLEKLTMAGKSITDSGIDRLKSLKSLKYLRVSAAGLTDESLESLKNLPKLESLELHGSGFTERGLSHIRAMTSLRRLSLEGTPRVINGPGIACLRSLPALDTLMLMSSQITDDGMAELATLPNLRVLYVRRSSVSPEARARLLNSRPQLSIFP